MFITFTAQKLRDTASETRSSVAFARHEMEQDGFLDALEAHPAEILDGLAPHHLPAVDREVLRDMGSVNPEADLAALVYRAKGQKHRLEQRSREGSIRQELRNAEERLAEVEREFDEFRRQGTDGNLKEPAKSRRWFKGLGQIAQGTALSIANAALALGVLKFPVSPETQTYGAMASVATGVGTILAGVGDLRNE
jgi:hypothetical protein